jgi:hypothetical protein
LTLPQARLLIEGSLPDPKRQPGFVLLVLKYHTRRNYQAYLARIFHKAPDFSPPAGFLGKNRFGSRHFFCSAAQQGAIASYVKQKGRF